MSPKQSQAILGFGWKANEQKTGVLKNVKMSEKRPRRRGRHICTTSKEDGILSYCALLILTLLKGKVSKNQIYCCLIHPIQCWITHLSINHWIYYLTIWRLFISKVSCKVLLYKFIKSCRGCDPFGKIIFWPHNFNGLNIYMSWTFCIIITATHMHAKCISKKK